MVVIDLDHILPYHLSLALKPPSKPLQSRASGSEVSEHSNFPLKQPLKLHPLPPRPPLLPPCYFISQSASPLLLNSPSSALYCSSGLLQVTKVPLVPESSIDIRHTTETNDFDKEFAKLDATPFKCQPCLNPSMDNDKYQQEDCGGNVATGQSVGLSSVSLEYITNRLIGDSPQATPTQAHPTPKKEGTSPPDPINSEFSSTYTASVDAESSNCVLDGLNDHCISADSYDLLRDNVTMDTAESEVVSIHDPKGPDLMSENTPTLTANCIQATSCSATVEEDLILPLAERQQNQSLYNEHDTSPGDEDGGQTILHPANDAASITRASDTPGQPETCAVSESGSQNHLKSPSRSYSVSVVIPVRPSMIATAEQTKTSLQTSSLDKQKRNSVSLSDINNNDHGDNDHGDNDYADRDKDGDDSDTLPHPQKRRR